MDTLDGPIFGPKDIQSYMTCNGIQGRIIYCDVPTLSVEAAALALNTSPENIVKSILFLVSDKPVIGIACGTARINYKAISDYYQIGRKQVKIASAPVVLNITGYQAGTVPPFGHRLPISTLIDQRVVKQEWVFAGGGAENVLILIKSADILEATHAQVLDLQFTGK